ncbi:tryptophan 7-halogenase [Amphiplicatus metriothermophilus]|uniref:Tryptophan halogenase n=1 Tax=Amphiplicatus metriothermophilus TaxID=1519374 RepID=A0A239PWH7_9PROT|nr:tryptophan 7-halogenase [Amphiplicatus metriothermophilus]MBB5518990.1 tryptophan halogenase [Amphiplicatus metriothermophilus]SNT74605.1 tryptophan halogenase [Amphiplicatus metriothermophilus]
MPNQSHGETRNIVIIGDGFDAWLSAAYLTRKLRAGYDIVVCAPPREEMQDHCAVFAGPATSSLHAELAVDERDLLRYCRGTFSLGAHFLDWTKPGKDYVVAFGAYGAPIETIAFHQCWRKRQRIVKGGDRFDSYSLSATAARAGKFAHPSRDPADIRSTYRYGYHVDVELYTDYMRRYAMHYGAKKAGARYANALLKERREGIDAVRLADGEIIPAFLALDCASAAAPLIEGALGATWTSFPSPGAVDSVITFAASSVASPSMTRIVAAKTCWRMDIPFQDGARCMIGYDSRAVSLDALAREHGPLENLEAKRIVRGRRAPAIGNVAALGESACRLDPLFCPAPATLIAGLKTLVELLPASQSGAETDEYNRIMSDVFERCNDFVTLQYWLAEQLGQHAWAAGAEKALSPHLRRKIEQFRSRGQIVQFDEEIYDQEMWIASLLGAGVNPERYDPFADGLSETMLDARLAALREKIAETVRAMPDQMIYLRQARATAPERSGS